MYEAVRSSPLLAEVIVATDSEEIMQVCRAHGWKAQMTSRAHRSGTERVHEVSSSRGRPTFTSTCRATSLWSAPEQIAALLQVMENPGGPGGNAEDSLRRRSRHPQPECRESSDGSTGARCIFPARPFLSIATARGRVYFKHLGLYAYRKTALDRFVKLPESSLERSERLEQLRFLENGIPIYVGETPHDSVGVDTEEDLQRVIRNSERCLQ